MKIWLDAHLPPALAAWIDSEFEVSAAPLRDLGMRDSSDREVFLAARSAGAVVMTKDQDFVLLLDELGTPPQIVWLTCGNTSNARLRAILTGAATRIIELLNRGEPLIEIGG